MLSELEAFAQLTSKNSYCVVFDTIVEDMPNNNFTDSSWGKGNNPKIAVREYLRLLQDHGCIASDGAPLAFVRYGRKHQQQTADYRCAQFRHARWPV
jgi:hypothetical protein